MAKILLLSLSLLTPLLAMQRVQVPCTIGGKIVVTAGQNSTTKVMQSYPNCTIAVYLTGSGGTKATIYSDNNGTAKTNPFTADSYGLGYFYLKNGTVDIQISGGSSPSIPAPYTYGAVKVFDIEDYCSNRIIAYPTLSSCLDISAGTGGGGGGTTPTSTSFSDIVAGSNTTAVMVVGTGATLSYAGSGSVNANYILGNAVAAIRGTSGSLAQISGATSAGNFLTSDASGNIIDSGITSTGFVTTSGSYSNPTWITSLSATKLTTGTVPSAALPPIDLTISGSGGGITGTLPAGNGGTGSTYTAFTGTSSSIKTFTLPNASSTILTSYAPVTMAQGGTGADFSAIAKGGILAGTGSNTLGILTAGTNGTVLTADSTATNGISWQSVSSLICPTCVTTTTSLVTNQLIMGTGAQGTQSIGSAGTTTTVLHGNASGTPAFSQIVNADIASSTIDAPSKLTNTLACDVRSRGAVGDGITDDTAAIQATITACGYGKTSFPSGKVYKVTAGLLVPYDSGSGSYLRPEIEGNGAMIHVPVTFTGTGLFYGTAASRESGPYIHGLSIVYDQPDSTDISTYHHYPPTFKFGGNYFTTISDVTVVNAWDVFDFRGDSGQVTVENAKISAYHYGILVDGSLDTMRFSKINFFPYSTTANQQVVWYRGVSAGDWTTGAWMAQIGRCDNCQISNSFSITHGVRYYAGATGAAFGSLSNFQCDTQCSIRVEAGTVQMNGGYVTLASTAPDAGISYTGGKLDIGGIWLWNNGMNVRSFDIFFPSTGVNSVSIDHSRIEGYSSSTGAAGFIGVGAAGSGSENYLRVTSNSFYLPSLGYTEGMAMHLANAGKTIRLVFTGNSMSDIGTGAWMSIDADDFHTVINNTYASATRLYFPGSRDIGIYEDSGETYHISRWMYGKAFIPVSVTGANLPPFTGTAAMIYCSDCNANTDPCTTGGTGAWAFKSPVDNAWRCGLH